jgi:hypothetical protein|tara:strand:+ start:1033 stop:1200 length:168 start_codon:yes stop_codon:yes gene_type:complete
MGYILVLKSSKEFVSRTDAGSLEEATNFFIRRKVMDEKAFHSLYEVLEDRRKSDK